MRRISSGQRANAALLVGVAAVTIAIVGSAGALPGRNHVDSGDVKNNTLRAKDLRDGKAVGRADLFAQEQTRWALVDGTGETIVTQSGGISVVAATTDGSSGVYVLDFGASLRGRALVASIGGTSITGDAGATNCGGAPEGVTCPGGDHDPAHALVQTPGGPHDFYVVQLPK